MEEAQRMNTTFAHPFSCCTEEDGFHHERDESHRLLSQRRGNIICHGSCEIRFSLIPVACHGTEPMLRDMQDWLDEYQ